MATSAGRAKRDREKARQERQALKRARRQSGREQSPDDDVEGDGDGAAGEPAMVPQDELLARLAELHQRFGDGEIGFEEFETTKEALLRDLQI